MTRGPDRDGPDDLARENAELRAEVAALRASTAFRLGHVVTRSVGRLARAARAARGSASPPTTTAPPPTPRPPRPPESAPSSDPDLGTAADDLEDPDEDVAGFWDATPGAGPLRRPSRAATPLTPPGPDARVRTAPLVPEWSPSGPADACPAGPVFVGGTGRSGTWALGRLLGAHPEWVCVPTELRFHSLSSGFGAVLAGERTPEDFASSVRKRWFRVTGGAGKPKGLQMIATPHEVTKALERFLARADGDTADALGRLLAELVAPFARGRGARGWTETTPANAAAAEALLTVYPRGALVHTIRDGRDVAASVRRMPWGPATIEEGLDWWAAKVVDIDTAVATVRDRVLTVRLEEFVHLDREAQFTRLVDFCGFVDRDNLHRYFDVKIDRDRGHVARWRGEVAATERDRIDGRYRELLAELTDLGVHELPVDPDVLDDLAVG